MNIRYLCLDFSPSPPFSGLSAGLCGFLALCVSALFLPLHFPPRTPELLSLKLVSNPSFCPGLWPAASPLPHPSIPWRAGWQLLLPLRDLSKFLRRLSAYTLYESALPHQRPWSLWLTHLFLLSGCNFLFLFFFFFFLEGGDGGCLLLQAVFQASIFTLCHNFPSAAAVPLRAHLVLFLPHLPWAWPSESICFHCRMNAEGVSEYFWL